MEKKTIDNDPWADEGRPGEEVVSTGIALSALEGSLSPEEKGDSFDALMEGAVELFSLGDFSGSLEAVEKALEVRPKDAKALDMYKRNQDTLLKMIESRVGGFHKVPRVCVDPKEIMWLNIDHRAGFVLSQIDGMVSYDDIVTLSGMSRFEACRILGKLFDEGVVK